MDLSKAFDTVDHSILLSKLHYYGIRGTPFNFFKSYLYDRYQYTMFNNAISDSVNIPCGVPQGSILGPLLFLIYINDLTHSSSNLQYIMYADDATLIYSQSGFNNIEYKVNNELDNVSNWFKANKLKLNISKTNFCIFHNRNHHVSTILDEVSLRIDSTLISRLNAVNFLGVIVDENLRWDVHIDNIVCKVSKSIGVLYKLRFYVPHPILFTLYNSLILPYLSYCIVVWGNSYKGKLDTLFKLQKKALRICTGSVYNAHSAPLFLRLKTLNIFDLFKYHTALIGFQYFQDLLPKCISAMFSVNKHIHTHETRLRYVFHLWKVKTAFSKRSIRNTLPNIWNETPQAIRSYKNLLTFKKKFKLHLYSNYH